MLKNQLIVSMVLKITFSKLLQLHHCPLYLATENPGYLSDSLLRTVLSVVADPECEVALLCSQRPFLKTILFVFFYF